MFEDDVKKTVMEEEKEEKNAAQHTTPEGHSL